MPDFDVNLSWWRDTIYFPFSQDFMSATLKEVPVLLGQTKLLHHDENGQTNSDVSSLKPWHFKPKKARYQVEARSGQTKKFNQKRWSDE